MTQERAAWRHGTQYLKEIIMIKSVCQ